jgi:cytochrome c
VKLATTLVVTIAVASQSVVANAAATTGNTQHGAVIFKQCAACHRIGPHAQNSVGPVLTGVVGRHAARYHGYSYSSGMKKSGIVWSEEELDKFLHAPRKLVPGTKMGFIGLKRDQDIADVIAYLKTFGAAGSKTASQSK